MITPRKNKQDEYEIRFSIGGVRHYRKFGKVSYQDAKKGADAFYNSFAAVQITSNVKPILSTVFRLYLEMTPKMSERSNQIAGTYLKKFIAFFGDVPVESISLLEIERYKNMRMKQVPTGKTTVTANATINRELSILIAATKKCFRKGVLSSNPFAGGAIERLENNKKFDYFRRPEWDSFISVFNQRELVLEDVKGNNKIYNSPPFRTEYLFNMERAADTFRLLLWTNSRLSEILKLTWFNVNLEEKVLSIYMGKVKTPKKLAITPDLKLMFERLKASTPNPSGYVLTRYDGKPFSTDQVERQFATGLKLSGFKRHLTPHDLRHTACSWLAKGNITRALVGATAGHQSEASTARYTHFDPETLAPVQELLSEEKEKLTNGLTNRNGLEAVKN